MGPCFLAKLGMTPRMGLGKAQHVVVISEQVVFVAVRSSRHDIYSETGQIAPLKVG